MRKKWVEEQGGKGGVRTKSEMENKSQELFITPVELWEVYLTYSGVKIGKQQTISQPLQ